MRYKSILLENYIGIYNGMKLESIYIDFTRCKNNLVVIKGDNGSGKSTLFKAINVIQDDSNMFIRGKSAKKIIEVYNDGIDYRIEYIHEFKNGGYISKGFFYKGSGDQLELCNPNGNISACKELIFSEFNLDANFASLTELSSKDRGLVSKIPSVRKQNFNNIITGVEAYNQIYKTLSKRSSVFKSMINSLLSKINNIGDEALLNSTLNSISQRIAGLEATKEELIANIAKGEAMVNRLDPDTSIQTAYSECESSIKQLNTLRASLYRIANSYITKLNGDIVDEEKIRVLEQSIERGTNDRVELSKKVVSILASNEDDAKRLEEKRAKLASLESENNYNTLLEMKSEFEATIAEAEDFFRRANIVNTSISSDEYVDGLNTLVAIKEVVDTLREAFSMSIIEAAVNSIVVDGDSFSVSYPDIKSEQDAISGIEEVQKNLESEYTKYFELYKITDKLKNKPDECNNSTCFFIKDAIEAAAQLPKENMDRVSKEISDNNATLLQLNASLDRDMDIAEAINQLSLIRRFIGTRKKILAKLPNGKIFSNFNEFTKRLVNGSDFSEIYELYQYISEASTFERYHNAVNHLAKVENDLKIYEAKNDLIESVIADIDNLQKSVDRSLQEVEACNNAIISIDTSIKQYETKLDIMRRSVEANNKLRDVDKEITDKNLEINDLKDSMAKIESILVSINKDTGMLENTRTQITSLERERSQIDFGLKQLVEYRAELEQFNAKYEKVEFMKACSSPTKGIQLIFIELYLRDIIKTANELLSLVLGGEFRLLKPIIDDRSFNFPCVGDGLPHDDISSLSDGQAAIMSVVLSAAIMYHSSTKYNVLKFDEVDGQLDTVNRSQFLFMVDQVRSILNCEQCITISHNNELDLRNVDLVILRSSDDELISSGGNIIFNYNA